VNRSCHTARVNLSPDIRKKRKTHAPAGFDSQRTLFLCCWLFLGSKASAISVTRELPASIFHWACSDRLSFSRRERMQVRDFLCDLARLTKLFAERCRVLREPDDSKTAVCESRAVQKIGLDSGHDFGQFGNCVRYHRVQSPALHWGNRNPARTNLPDPGDEICNQQNSDCAVFAIERVPTLLSACARNERGSHNYLAQAAFLREVRSAPHLSPLPESGERRTGERAARIHESATTTRLATIRLSLSQRERIKVRDCSVRPSSKNPVGSKT